MGVSATNMIQGPATIYRGSFGAVEPVDIDTEPGVGWTDVGGTKDGLEFEVNDEYAVIDVDQIIYDIGRTRTKRGVSAKTQMAEATLENLAHAINNSAPVDGVLTGDDGVAAFLPDYSAIIIDGIAPGGFRRRITLRKVMPTDGVGTAYKKDSMTLVPVTWALHWVSPSIPPFKIEDASA